jgi:hydroxymethylglutaryl-CoA lyase
MFRPRIIRGLLPFVRSISHSQSSPRSDNFIKIVEVGPRDGLQNEPNPVSLDVKVELINRLGQAGVGVIESGSFVSPKWVPQVRISVLPLLIDKSQIAQMAGTSEVLQQITHLPSVKYPVLVPNLKGLETLLSLLSSLSPSDPPITDEIAIFTASSDTFNLRNTNATVQQSLERLSPVVELALKNNLRVRGYVSTVITCPYEGPTEPKKVAQVTKDLVDMGCYEVSLGDTVGTGTPMTIGNMLDSVIALTPAEKLAVSFVILIYIVFPEFAYYVRFMFGFNFSLKRSSKNNDSLSFK